MKTKILLAEDDLNLGKILKSYLEAKDFNVDLYLNGEEALLGFQRPIKLLVQVRRMPIFTL